MLKTSIKTTQYFLLMFVLVFPELSFGKPTSTEWWLTQLQTEYKIREARVPAMNVEDPFWIIDNISKNNLGHEVRSAFQEASALFLVSHRVIVVDSLNKISRHTL